MHAPDPEALDTEAPAGWAPASAKAAPAASTTVAKRNRSFISPPCSPLVVPALAAAVWRQLHLSVKDPLSARRVRLARGRDASLDGVHGPHPGCSGTRADLRARLAVRGPPRRARRGRGLLHGPSRRHPDRRHPGP